MPSCSSKRSNLRENERTASQLGRGGSCNETPFPGQERPGQSSRFVRTVWSYPSQQVSRWCCRDRDGVTGPSDCSRRSRLPRDSPKPTGSRLIERFGTFENEKVGTRCQQCAVSNWSKAGHKGSSGIFLVSLPDHDVITFAVVYVLLKVVLCIESLKQWSFQISVISASKQLIDKVSWVSDGNKHNSVMEVDGQSGPEINSCVKNLPNGDNLSGVKSLLSSSSSSPVSSSTSTASSSSSSSPEKDDKPDNVKLSVIKENQIMKVADSSQSPRNSLKENSIGVQIKEESVREEEKNGNCMSPPLPPPPPLVNGDVKYHLSGNSVDYKKSVDFASTVSDKNSSSRKVNSVSVKERLNGSAGDVIKSSADRDCKRNGSDIETTHEVKSEETLKAETKSSERGSSERTKPRDKEQCSGSTSVNHVVSSSSSSSPSGSSSTSKKHSSQSHLPSSSSSSSSSKHKYKDSRDKSKSSSSSRNGEKSSSESHNRSDDRSKSDSRSSKSSKSCHHRSDEKCHCKSRHHSHHHSSSSSSSSKSSKKSQTAKTQCTADEISFELGWKDKAGPNPYFTRVPWVPHPQLANLKYGRFYRIEEDRNGGATVCHLYMDEISHLSESQMKECAIEFIKLSYSEDENECAYHVMGIVHGAATYLPDLVDYMADHYPTLTVKTGSLASRDNHTTTMSQYREEVYKTYSNGTFRYAPLDQLSICGVLGEEVGAYFPDFVARLEQSPFMKPVMPWSFLSVVQTDNPRESNDGPIFWVRPGEQMLPANEALKESARPKKRRNNELDNLGYIGGSRYSEARESLFMDRTKAHADQVGVDYGISNTAPTAAVGVLKAVNCGHPEHGNRATKDVVAFHAQDYTELLEILMLDLYEPPQTQCTKWIEVSKLNTLRREGIRYAHLQLHDNDVYYLPRKIIHQFQTISSVASVAWHIRYREYFSILGAPNLHTPTGINKGQVFYEKKNVTAYCPPVRDPDLLAAVTNVETGLKTPKKSDRLKEYSPFKHSPRKMHKHQSPRSASKKEKQSEGTPSDADKKPDNFGDSVSTNSNSNSSSVKRERSISVDETKGEREEEFPKTSSSSSSSEKSEMRRSSSHHTPSKREKSQSSSSSHSSGHRNEVKNLEAEFDSKKEKSKSESSSSSSATKSKHGDSKHGKSSKQSSSRHDKPSKSTSGGSSSSSSSSNRHEKGESRQEKREGGDRVTSSSSSSTSNGQNSYKAKTDDENNGVLKRRHSESPSHAPLKRIKEENPSPGPVENGMKSPREGANGGAPVAQVKLEPGTTRGEDEDEVRGDGEYRVKGERVVKSNCTNESDEAPKDRIVNRDAGASSNGGSPPADIDLKPKTSHNSGRNSQVPPFPPLPQAPAASPPPPPPPSDSPPANQQQEQQLEEPSTPPPKTSSPHFHDPSNSSSLIKKLKKKAVKKSPENYDLLGDIMSKMDKKKM